MRTTSLSLAALTLALLTAPAVGQDVEKGRQAFEMCLACHEAGGPGPVLNGIFESKMGSVEGFEYSETFAKANAEAKVWTEEALDQFLAAPQTYLPDNKMAFGAVTDDKERKDLIAFLKTLR